MNRISIKFVVGVLLALLLVALVDRGLIRPYRMQERRNNAAHMLGGLVHLLRERVPGLDKDQIDRELQTLALTLGGGPVSLQPRSTCKLSRQERQTLASGDIILRAQQNNPVVVLAESWDPQKLLILGPLPSANTKQNIYDLVSTLVGIGGVVLVALFVAIPLVRRLTQLGDVATYISQGKLDIRSQDKHEDELGLLARRFNSMADSLQDLLKQQQQLIRAVSHELRTPIARLRFDLELLQSVKDASQREQKIESMSADIDDLESLVAELLIFLRYRRGVQQQSRQVILLHELAELLGEKYRSLRPEIKLDLCSQKDDKLIDFIGEVSSVERAIGNLLANALRFAQQRVELTCHLRKEGVAIWVDDDGPGIPKEMREAVFEPFRRVDEDRNRNSGGAGLGLAIAQSIVQAHHGKIWIEESPLGGARFMTLWPLTAPEDQL